MFRVVLTVETECCKVLAMVSLICQTLKPEHLLIHLAVLKNIFCFCCAILRSLCFIVSAEQGDSNVDKETNKQIVPSEAKISTDKTQNHKAVCIVKSTVVLLQLFT